jgi:hypothetical protein
MLMHARGCLIRTDGSAARERYDRYGGGLFPVAWYDLQRFWAGHLPPGALQIGAAFERYEETAEGITVHLKVATSHFSQMRQYPLLYLASMKC